MTPDSAQAFGVALMAMWGTAGAVALGRSVAKSPAARELAATVRKMNLAAKGALVAGLVGLVAIGGTKPGGNNPQRLGQRPLSSTRIVATTNTPPFALVEVRTNGVSLVGPSTNAIVSESIRRRGTSEGGEWVEAETSFFRWGTNLVSRVFASPAVLSFGTIRHPALGAALPDGSPAESLVALRTPLGLAPEANWAHLAAPSRFWHAATPGGRVFTWENALLDRQADCPATIQIETRADGDFFYRYDFSAVAPTNDFFVGAQLGPAAVEALGVRGGATNAATVFRVNGSPVRSGVSVADLFASPRLELRWKNVADLGDLSGDTDGDGLTDWQEVFLHGTSPIQADTDHDGLSDASELVLGYSPDGYDMDDDGLVDGIDPHPLAWDGDGFGTSPLWVQCSFENAAEINAEGYDNYVLRITGGSSPRQAPILRSRATSQSGYRKLYELDVSVADIAGDQRIQVKVGEKAIVLRSGGTHRFALEKGREYELVTDAPHLVSFSSPDSGPVIVQPTWTENGRVYWRASGIEVAPATHHFYSPGEECEFSALCLDCHPANATDWNWSCDDARLSLTTSGPTNCTVSWLGPTASWGSARFTVSFLNLGQVVSKTVFVTFGDNSEPQTSVGMGFPSAFFAESEQRVPLVVTIAQDDPIEGTLTLSAVDGGALLGVSSDKNGLVGVSLPLEVSVPAESVFVITNYVVAAAPSTRRGATRFDAAFTHDNGDPGWGDSVPTTAIRVDGISVPSAPSTGLAVLAGTSVGLHAGTTPVGAGSLVETEWLLAQRKSDGSYHDWTPVASGVPAGLYFHDFQAPGVFAIRADVSCGHQTNTVYYQRGATGPYDYDKIEPQDHIGVASTRAQLELREFAVDQLGRTDFALAADLPSMNDFSAVSSGKWKCNAFVAYCAISVGQAVPAIRGTPPFSAYPPLANDWATGSPISGWVFLGTGSDPEPGWICGHPSSGPHGHVGIVDYDGYCIAAGTHEVNRRYNDFLDGACGYNKKESQNE